MRNLVVGLVCAVALASVPLSAEAGVGSWLPRAGVKLTHGLADVAYSPLELLISPVTHAVDFDRHSRASLVGAGTGMFVGLIKAGARFGRGVTDTFTFWLPSERHDRWRWEWSYAGFQRPLSSPQMIEDAH